MNEQFMPEREGRNRQDENKTLLLNADLMVRFGLRFQPVYVMHEIKPNSVEWLVSAIGMDSVST